MENLKREYKDKKLSDKSVKEHELGLFDTAKPPEPEFIDYEIKEPFIPSTKLVFND
jgi:hypothetical protein